MLRFLTAGESHGQALVMTLDGMPAGLEIDIDALNAQLRRRQGGYGRGRRMQIESDRAEILAGVRHGRTTGAPIALLIRNRDWVNWQQTMYVEREMPEGATGAKRADVTRPRPGHADLAGAIKYGHDDIRDVLERASARETAARVAAGIAGAPAARRASASASPATSRRSATSRCRTTRAVSFDEAQALADDAPLRCVDAALQQQMIAAIDAAKEAGDTLGGAFEVIAHGRAARPRLLRAVGPQARWPAGAGADVHPRHQGGRHRHRARGRLPSRLARARRNPAAGRRRGRRRRGRPTTPAASRAASPTARTSASPAS